MVTAEPKIKYPVSSVPPTKNKGGRPTKLTLRRLERIALAVDVTGYNVTWICMNANITRQTFYNWKKQAEIDPSKYEHALFLGTISRRPDVKKHTRWATRQALVRRSHYDWRAAAYLLHLMEPESYPSPWARKKFGHPKQCECCWEKRFYAKKERFKREMRNASS
jgi:hypothetical protein